MKDDSTLPAQELPVEVVDLTADQILAVNDITINPVDVPEWGGRVYVRTMSATARERYIESIRKISGAGKKQTVEIILPESGAKLAQQTICDKHGKLLFSIAQIKALGEKSSKALQRCIDASALINGLSDEAEEAAKNDSPARMENDSASSSDSPVT